MVTLLQILTVLTIHTGERVQSRENTSNPTESMTSRGSQQ